MPNGIASQMKAGTCPHGMPLGGCPICSGMGGGGAKKADHTAKTGEMSWNECYAIGQMMKSAQLNSEVNKQVNESALLQNAVVQKVAVFMAEKLAAVRNVFVNIGAGIVQTVSKVAVNLANAAIAVSNFVKPALVAVSNFANQAMAAIKSAFINITDKLAAIYGEAKLALERFTEEAAKKLKKTLFSLFGYVEETNKQTQESEEAENEKRKIFNLDRFKNELSQFFNPIKENK